VNASFPFSQFYPPGEWLPVRIDLLNETGQETAGYVELPIHAKGGMVRVRSESRVPANSRVTDIVYAYFPAEIYQTAQQEKTGLSPPVTVVQWYGESGGEISRVEMLARPLGATRDQKGNWVEGASSGPAMLLLLVNPTGSGDKLVQKVSEIITLREQLSGSVSYALGSPTVDVAEMPRQGVGYSACQAVVIDQASADEMDEAQRQSLLDYIRGGGVVVLSAPMGEYEQCRTWLGPWLPVKIVGRRETSGLEVVGEKPLALIEPSQVSEAIEGQGEVLLRGPHYVHAAYRSIGMGRLVFVSFPVSALSPDDERSMKLWSDLLNLNVQGVDWRQSALGAQQTQFIERMVGKSVPPWKLAAIVVGAYLLVVLGVQGVWGGTRRPKAFAVVVIVAVAGSAGLVVYKAAASRHDRLNAAAIGTMDMGPGGGGVQQRTIAYIGQNTNLELKGANTDVSIRPAVSGDVMLKMPPFDVPEATVFADKIEQVWQVRGPIPADLSVSATGRFGPDGLELTVENGLKHPLRSPVLVWGDRAFGLGDVEGERSTLTATTPNAPGDYTNATIFTSDLAKLRGAMLAASLRPATMTFGQQSKRKPILACWLEEAPDLLQSPEGIPGKVNTLVRVEAELAPTAVGTGVRIPAGFMEMQRSEAAGLPYDFIKNEWITSRTPGSWLLRFVPPAGIGKLQVDSATLSISIDAPQYVVKIQRVGRREGKPVLNPAGETIAQWNQPVGQQTPVTFACGPTDVDEQGGVWIQFTIEESGGAGLAQGATGWLMKQIGMGVEGKVVGNLGNGER
jgi:hypothetical protein